MSPLWANHAHRCLHHGPQVIDAIPEERNAIPPVVASPTLPNSHPLDRWLSRFLDRTSGTIANLDVRSSARNAGLMIFPVAPLTAQAQAIRGQLVEDGSGSAIPDAPVVLIDEANIVRAGAVSDADGRFSLMAPGPGRYSLRVDAPNRTTLTSAAIELSADQVIEVQLRLSSEIVRLTTVVVTADAEPAVPRRLRAFYERARRGFPGRFVTRDEIAARNPSVFTDILRTALGVRVVSTGGRGSTIRLVGERCTPSLYLDGFSVGTVDMANELGLDGLVSLDQVESVEVYRGSQVPIELAGGGTRCGVVAVWTRGGAPRGSTTAVSGGVGAGFDASMLQFVFRPNPQRVWSSVVRLRLGKYDPQNVIGRKRALQEQFPGRRWYVSLYGGRQGTAPMLPWREVAYLRIAGGASVYDGRPALRQDSVALFRVAPRLGVGVEFALGFRPARGVVRPWVEFGAGAEYVSRAALRFVRPSVLAGLEIGRAGR